MISTDTWLKVMCGIMINAVLFGLGAVTVLTVPALAAHAKYLIPVVVVTCFALSPFIAVPIARRMRLKNWGQRAWREGDSISGR